MLDRAMPERASAHRANPSRRAGALALAAVLTTGGAALATTFGSASAATVNLLTNPGLETGTLSGWSCANGSVVTTPVHSGSYALNGGASASDTGQCQQTVAVQPNTAYTLSAWVQGSYVYLGATGTGVNSTVWTPSSAAWSQLSTTFNDMHHHHLPLCPGSRGADGACRCRRPIVQIGCEREGRERT